MNNLTIIQKIKLAAKFGESAFNLASDFVKTPEFLPFPRFINLFVTNKCNLNCKMCLNAEYRNKNSLPNNSSLELVEKILPELVCYKPFINIAGGEPLINRDTIKIIELLSKNRIFTSMTTNGFLLPDFAEKIVRSGLEFISLSLDHFDEKSHDNGRGVSGSQKRLIFGLEKLVRLRKKTPSNIKINTVIRRDNFKQLSDMYDFVEKLGVDEWSLQHYSFKTKKAACAISNFYKKFGGGYSDGVEIGGDYYFSPDDVFILEKELKKIQNKSRRKKIRLSAKPLVNDLYAYYGSDYPSVFSRCQAPFNAANIQGHLTVSLCSGYEIGDLRKASSLFEMWNSKKAKDFQKLIREQKIIPPCFRCCSLDYIF